MSIRLRLSLMVAVTTAVLVIVGGVALEVSLGSGIRASLEDSLRRSAARVSADLAGGALPLARGASVAMTAGNEAVVQVLGSPGGVEYTTEAVGPGALLSRSEVARAAKGTVFLRQGASAGHGSRLLLAEPGPGGGKQVLVVGTSLDEVANAVTRLRDGLLVAAPVLILIAAGGGWLLAGRALEPVEQLRAEAETISAGSAGRRIAVPKALDEIGRLAATLNGLLDRLHGALARQKEFVAAASHELRAPLAGLQAELEVARLPGRSAGEMRRSLEVCADRLDQLTRLAGDLLLLARGDEQALSLELAPHPLEPLVAQSLQAFRRRADGRGVALVLDGDPGAVATVDGMRFRQVVDNLVGNAFSHATGSPFIEVSVRRETNWVEVEVRDGGPGFPGEFVEHAFDRFARAEAGRTTKEWGSGLGLPIVRMLVEAQNGTVDAHNRPEGGAAVIVRLPASPVATS